MDQSTAEEHRLERQMNQATDHVISLVSFVDLAIGKVVSLCLIDSERQLLSYMQTSRLLQLSRQLIVFTLAQKSQ